MLVEKAPRPSSLLSRSVVSSSLQPHGLQPTRLLCPGGFSRPECWSGLPGPPPGDLPNPGIEPWSPSLQADSLPSEPKKWKPKLERNGKEAIICSHGSFNKCPYLNVFVCECVCMLCLFQTPQTGAHQAPLSMEFLRQEHWSGCPFLILLLLLLLSRFSHVRLRATPQTAARQAPPSLGFSRQECWSRLPFPSPVQESEK